MMDFAAAFSDASTVLITDIYPAGEKPIPGISAEVMADAMRQAGHSDVQVVPQVSQVPAALEAISRDGDLVITLGAGSVTVVGDQFLQRLQHRESA